MTSEELRALAVRLEDHAGLHRDTTPHDAEQAQWERDLRSAADYLRACADALDAGPVAQVVAVTLEGAAGPSYMDLRFVSNRPSPDRQLLYPLAMPAPTAPSPPPECQTEAAMPAPASDLSEGQYRDMLDAESAPCPVTMPAALRLPEPMTKAELLTIRMKARASPEAETTNWPALACRAVEAEVIRRVKECNK
jgi:hypothetical protein